MVFGLPQRRRKRLTNVFTTGSGMQVKSRRIVKESILSYLRRVFQSRRGKRGS